MGSGWSGDWFLQCALDIKGADKMSRELMKRCVLLTLIICLLTLLIDFRIALGFLFGAIGSVLLYLRNVAFCNAVLDEKSTKHLKTFGRFMQSYAINFFVVFNFFKNIFFKHFMCFF